MLNIGENITILSVLLVFVTVFVDISVRKADKFLMIPRPNKNNKYALKDYNYKFGTTLFQLILVALATFSIGWLFAPDCIYVISISTVDLLNFNVLQSAFILIELFILIFFFYQLKKIRDIVNKFRNKNSKFCERLKEAFHKDKEKS